MVLRARIFLAASAAAALASWPAQAALENPIASTIARSPFTVDIDILTQDLVSPDYLTHAGDGSGRVFAVDQTGVVRVMQGDTLLAEPFLDVRSRMVTLNPDFDERGLLGLAFHPNFASNGKLYTYHSAPVGGDADFTVPMPAGVPFDNQGVITEWTVDPANPNRVDPGSARELMRIDDPQFNHNGGTLAFGPDGFMYISIGDGGFQDDQGDGHNPATGNAQDTSNILGKILRIDVDGTDSANGQYGIPDSNPFADAGDPGADEIYAYGLRNPYRMAFDPVTGQLIAGDAGQANIEEINRITIGGNYGWRVKEGTFLFDPLDLATEGVITADSPGAPAGLIDPIGQYDHDDGIAVVGGFVFRGELLPEALLGQYIFGDFTGRLFSMDLTSGEILSLTDAPIGWFIKGFGQDAAGEIYALLGREAGPSGIGAIARLFAQPQQVPEPAPLGILATVGLGSLLWRQRRGRGVRLDSGR